MAARAHVGLTESESVAFSADPPVPSVLDLAVITLKPVVTNGFFARTPQVLAMLLSSSHTASPYTRL